MDEDVRLEFVASVEMDAHRIARFIQELKEVPAEAWCEVQTVWSKPQHAAATRNNSVATTAQMRCERRVADFLCQRFNKQVCHVSQGELLLVRCRRVLTRSLPTAHSTQSSQSNKIMRVRDQGLDEEHAGVLKKADEKRSPAVSRSTMIDLLDCLGDQIVDVLHAFQTHAVQSDSKPQLTMIGLVYALTQASKKEPPPIISQAKAHRKEAKAPSSDHVPVQKVRHLLTQLIDNGVISTTSLPSANDNPFLTYTDFIACYVAYMEWLGRQDSVSTTPSTRCGTLLKKS